MTAWVPRCVGNINLDSNTSKEEIKIATSTDKTEKQVEPRAAAAPYQLFCWLTPGSGSQAAAAEFIIHFKYIRGEKQRLKRWGLASYPENAGEGETKINNK